VEATLADKLIEQLICDRLPLKHWFEGRVVLLGDAAHPIVPSLGQGANMAMEDAYELAEYLSNESDVEAALKAYESSRIPRTGIIYDRSATQGSRSYQSDSETMLGEMMISPGMSQNEFEAWLYCYPSLSNRLQLEYQKAL
jgi:salicylate hydroxylase